jgi:hypothetical protein
MAIEVDERILVFAPLQNAAFEVPGIETVMPQASSKLLAANTDGAIANDRAPLIQVTILFEESKR